MSPVKVLNVSLSDAELWLLLPLCASVLMAVVAYFVLNAAVDEASKVSDEEKAALKRQLSDLGAEVTRKAKEKAEKDQQLIAARLERERAALAAAATQTADGSSPTAESSTSTSTVSPSESKGLRRRRGLKAKAKTTTASDSSDNDWELVDTDEATADTADATLSAEYQTAADSFIEAVHQNASDASVEELHRAVLDFTSVVRSLVDDTVATTLPPASSDSSSAPPAPPASAVAAIRSSLLSQLVDSATFPRLQALTEAHPSTALAADATSLLAALTPYLYS